MNKNILLLTNSNLFTVYAGTFIKKHYESKILNTRYPNEEFTKEEHFANQIRDVFNEYYCSRGILHSRYYFTFNERLALRIKTTIEDSNPSMIFYEMQTLSNAEWSLLEFLHETYNIPIAVYVPSEDKIEKNLSKLAKRGVREIFTQLNEEVFKSIIKRYLETHY